MSKNPSSLDKGQAEHLTEGDGVFGQTATALEVLCCFDGSCVEGDFRSTCSAHEVAKAIGRPREVVDSQIAQLVRLGYLERTPDSRYRLSGQLLSETEVAASSPRHSRTAARIRIEGDKGASSTTS
jgi:DNA-binding IclR family transcriptional regulator